MCLFIFVVHFQHGLTPLHQAAQQGHAAVINQLLQKGADPNETANVRNMSLV